MLIIRRKDIGSLHVIFGLLFGVTGTFVLTLDTSALVGPATGEVLHVLSLEQQKTLAAIFYEFIIHCDQEITHSWTEVLAKVVERMPEAKNWTVNDLKKHLWDSILT